MRPTTETAILTVAAIRRLKGTRVTEYLFNEREQIFRPPAAAKPRAGASTRLRAALKKNLPVKAVLDPRRGVVRRIDLPSPEEIAEFERTRILLEKPDKAVRINLSSIDPTTFNIVDRYLKFPTFRLCAQVVPDYKTAKKIFDFCAKQSCHLPGPPTVTPCIPFQYVRDGCYARAHKMRKIIVERYGYCCEKVFSFANQNDDTLAVRADKWGGCCVTWWYHVAPLIRVRIKIGRIKFVLALVVDPSMFDKPVLLSTWLMAQENASCAANANVSMYSIQPGSAYSPANYQGTSFATDPTYSSTNSTLIGYQNLTTCP
jgi:glutaminase-like protein